MEVKILCWGDKILVRQDQRRYQETQEQVTCEKIGNYHRGDKTWDEVDSVMLNREVQGMSGTEEFRNLGGFNKLRVCQNDQVNFICQV